MPYLSDGGVPRFYPEYELGPGVHLDSEGNEFIPNSPSNSVEFARQQLDEAKAYLEGISAP